MRWQINCSLLRNHQTYSTGGALLVVCPSCKLIVTVTKLTSPARRLTFAVPVERGFGLVQLLVDLLQLSVHQRELDVQERLTHLVVPRYGQVQVRTKLVERLVSGEDFRCAVGNVFQRVVLSGFEVLDFPKKSNQLWREGRVVVRGVRYKTDQWKVGCVRLCLLHSLFFSLRLNRGGEPGDEVASAPRRLPRKGGKPEAQGLSGSSSAQTQKQTRTRFAEK